jgi:hypothetical protein
VKLAELLDSAADAARGIASGPLGASDLQWSGPSSAPLPGMLCGIYIPLIMRDFALQFGLLATREGCAALARALLRDTGAAVESDDDVFDAVGEVTNLVAGNIKVLLADRVELNIGVPLAMRGRAIPLGGSQSIHGVLKVDRNDVWLVMTGTAMR